MEGSISKIGNQPIPPPKTGESKPPEGGQDGSPSKPVAGITTSYSESTYYQPGERTIEDFRGQIVWADDGSFTIVEQTDSRTEQAPIQFIGLGETPLPVEASKTPAPPEGQNPVDQDQRYDVRINGSSDHIQPSDSKIQTPDFARPMATGALDPYLGAPANAGREGTCWADYPYLDSERPEPERLPPTMDLGPGEQITVIYKKVAGNDQIETIMDPEKVMSSSELKRLGGPEGILEAFRQQIDYLEKINDFLPPEFRSTVFIVYYSPKGPSLGISDGTFVGLNCNPHYPGYKDVAVAAHEMGHDADQNVTLLDNQGRPTREAKVICDPAEVLETDPEFAKKVSNEPTMEGKYFASNSEGWQENYLLYIIYRGFEGEFSEIGPGIRGQGVLHDSGFKGVYAEKNGAELWAEMWNLYFNNFEALAREAERGSLAAQGVIVFFRDGVCGGRTPGPDPVPHLSYQDVANWKIEELIRPEALRSFWLKESFLGAKIQVYLLKPQESIEIIRDLFRQDKVGYGLFVSLLYVEGWRFRNNEPFAFVDDFADKIYEGLVHYRTDTGRIYSPIRDLPNITFLANTQIRDIVYNDVYEPVESGLYYKIRFGRTDTDYWSRQVYNPANIARLDVIARLEAGGSEVPVDDLGRVADFLQNVQISGEILMDCHLARIENLRLAGDIIPAFNEILALNHQPEITNFRIVAGDDIELSGETVVIGLDLLKLPTAELRAKLALGSVLRIIGDFVFQEPEKFNILMSFFQSDPYVRDLFGIDREMTPLQVLQQLSFKFIFDREAAVDFLLVCPESARAAVEVLLSFFNDKVFTGKLASLLNDKACLGQLDPDCFGKIDFADLVSYDADRAALIIDETALGESGITSPRNLTERLKENIAMMGLYHLPTDYQVSSNPEIPGKTWNFVQLFWQNKPQEFLEAERQILLGPAAGLASFSANLEVFLRFAAGFGKDCPPQILELVFEVTSGMASSQDFRKTLEARLRYDQLFQNSNYAAFLQDKALDSTADRQECLRQIERIGGTAAASTREVFRQLELAGLKEYLLTRDSLSEEDYGSTWERFSQLGGSTAEFLDVAYERFTRLEPKTQGYEQKKLGLLNLIKTLCPGKRFQRGTSLKVERFVIDVSGIDDMGVGFQGINAEDKNKEAVKLAKEIIRASQK